MNIFGSNLFFKFDETWIISNIIAYNFKINQLEIYFNIDIRLLCKILKEVYFKKSK